MKYLLRPALFFATLCLTRIHAAIIQNGIYVNGNITEPPVYTSSTNNTNSSSTALTARVNCYYPTFFDSRVAASRDCLQAIELLPDVMTPGYFHYGGPPDGFELPAMEHHGTCMIILSLDDGQPDLSSWSMISHVASQLIEICSIGLFPRGYTGGWMKLGERGAIRISVEKYRPVQSTSENVTAIDAVL